MSAAGAPGVELHRWWSRRWLEQFDEEVGAAAARRVQRGRALARRGAVDDLEVVAGRITASVADDRAGPHRVELHWPAASGEAWDRAVAALSAELRFTAALLDGGLPDGLDELFAAAGVELFPSLGELDLRCPCSERARLCPHVAAVHAAAALRFERDPFLLLALRGRDQDQLLRALRAERGSDAPAATPAELDLSGGLFTARGDLDDIVLHPSPVEEPGALVRHLGPPPGLADPEPLARLVERAAAGAWRLAAGDGAEAADEELLLAELRAQRVGSAGSLAEALGRDSEEVREHLDRLFEAGAVMRTGSGEGARYRAATSSSHPA